jgi:hypothetical protein
VVNSERFDPQACATPLGASQQKRGAVLTTGGGRRRWRTSNGSVIDELIVGDRAISGGRRQNLIVAEHFREQRGGAYDFAYLTGIINTLNQSAALI